LSQKAKDGELILIDSLKASEIKTKEANKIVEAISKNKGFEKLVNKKNNAAVVALVERDENTEKSFRNIKNLRLDLVQNMNVVDLLNHKYVMIENPEASFKILSQRVGKKVAKETKK
jgi:ribosomal protein L4